MYSFYLTISLIAALILLFIDLGMYGHPVNIFTVFFAIHAFLSGSALWISKKNNNQKVFRPGIILLTLPVNIIALALLLLALVNIPPAARQKEQITLKLPANEETAAYRKLTELLESDSGCFARSDEQADPSQLFSEACKNERKELFVFLARTPMAAPMQEREGEIILPWNLEPPRYMRLRNGAATELAAVANLLATGNVEAANMTYLTMWRAAATLLTAKNDLISAAVTTKIINNLIDFYHEHQSELVDSNDELQTLLEGLAQQLDRSFVSAFELEFAMLKSFLFGPERKDLLATRWQPNQFIRAYYYKWPFLDKNQTHNKMEAWIGGLIQLATDSSEQAQQKFSELEQASFSAPPRFSIKNPYGTYLQLMALPNFSRFVENKNHVRQKIESLQASL